jgi:histidinol dehydrogenase
LNPEPLNPYSEVEIENKETEMNIYDYPSTAGEEKVSAIVNRDLDFKKKDYQTVSRIIDDVRRNGDAAVVKYANRFDAPRLTARSMKVSTRELETGAKKVDRRFMRAMNRAASQIEAFHRQQIQHSWLHTRTAGQPGKCRRDLCARCQGR